MDGSVEIVTLFDGDWGVRLGLLFFGIVLVDAREVWSKIDGVFISVVFEVVPQAMIEGNRIGFLSVWWGENKEIVSLFVLGITGGNMSDPSVLGLSRVWFKVSYLILV